MRLTVVRRYLANDRDAVCVDENGKEHYVDLFVDGALREQFPTVDDLIGKTIEVDYLTPHIEIAGNPRVVT